MTSRVDPSAPRWLPSPPISPDLIIGTATPQETEQHYPGLMIQPCRHPTFHKLDSTGSDFIHCPYCTYRTYALGSQTQSQQETSLDKPGGSLLSAGAVQSNTGMSVTRRPSLLFLESALGFPEGREASSHHPDSGKANRAVQNTPDDTLGVVDRRLEGEENLESTGSDQDEDCSGSEKSKVEQLAEKRKMKRFRLTHGQTRYLMGEFARQKHPDANQREKLSHDIPGLSPRQVQVWFQNRRAKLKRLPADDQERILRSRALPEDFDFTHTLRPVSGAQRPPREPVASLSNLSLADGGERPAMTIRHDDQVLRSTNRFSMNPNVLHGGGSTRSSFSLSPVSSPDEGLYDGTQYPTSATYSRIGSPNIGPGFGNDPGQYNFSTGIMRQGYQNAIQQASTNQFSAESHAIPMEPSAIAFANSHYNYGATPSLSSPAPLRHQSINRIVSPLASPSEVSTIYEPSSAQYSPAAGSAGYPAYSASYAGLVDQSLSQSDQFARLAQFGQHPRSVDHITNPFQPPPSTSIYRRPQGNADDAMLLGQPRLYTEPEL